MELFKRDDHSDLLLPTNRSLISHEYRNLLSYNNANQNMLLRPELDGQPAQKWVVISQTPTVSLLKEILSSNNNPLKIRERLESNIVTNRTHNL